MIERWLEPSTRRGGALKNGWMHAIGAKRRGPRDDALCEDRSGTKYGPGTYALKEARGPSTEGNPRTRHGPVLGPSSVKAARGLGTVKAARKKPSAAQDQTVQKKKRTLSSARLGTLHPAAAAAAPAAAPPVPRRRRRSCRRPCRRPLQARYHQGTAFSCCRRGASS